MSQIILDRKIDGVTPTRVWRQYYVYPPDSKIETYPKNNPTATYGVSIPTPKAIFFDMDATVVVEETLVTFAESLGLTNEVNRLTEAAMRGEMDFQESLATRVLLFRGKPTATLDQFWQRLTLQPGIREFVSFIQTKSVPCHIITGGFLEMAIPIGTQIGIPKERIHAHQFGVSSKKFTGEVIGEKVDGEGKLKWVQSVCQVNGWAPSDIVTVGDGANDIPMSKFAGTAVGFHPKPVLAKVCDAVNFSQSHEFLFPLLGFYPD